MALSNPAEVGHSDDMRTVRLAAAAFIGALVGGLVAVNIVIFSGAERGYESSLSDVFEHSTIVGILAIVALAAGPVAGVLVFLRAQRRQAEDSPGPTRR